MNRLKLDIQMFSDPYVDFKDYPDTTTPINASNLNKIQTDAIDELVDRTTGDMVVNSISTKNWFDFSSITNGDIIRADRTLKLSSRQSLWLETGTYTFSTNMTSLFRFQVLMETVGPPPLTTYPTYTYTSGWQTATGTSTLTFTVSTAGWFVLLLSKVDNSVISQNERDTILSFNYQLEKGTTASIYTPYQNLKPDVEPVVLFDGSIAVEVNGTLTIWDDISNYKYVEIFYTTSSNSNAQSSTKIDVFYSKRFIMQILPVGTSGILQFSAVQAIFSDTTLTFERWSGIQLNTSTNAFSTLSTKPRIFKILGYK